MNYVKTRAAVEVSYRFFGKNVNDVKTRAAIEVYRFFGKNVNDVKTRAAIEVYRFLARMFSEWRGSLTQNRRKSRPWCFLHDSRCIPS